VEKFKIEKCVLKKVILNLTSSAQFEICYVDVDECVVYNGRSCGAASTQSRIIILKLNHPSRLVLIGTSSVLVILSSHFGGIIRVPLLFIVGCFHSMDLHSGSCCS